MWLGVGTTVTLASELSGTGPLTGVSIGRCLIDSTLARVPASLQTWTS